MAQWKSACLEIEELCVGASSASLRCVLEQVLQHWFNPGRPVDITEILFTHVKIISSKKEN